jgi:hypothetical protein
MFKSLRVGVLSLVAVPVGLAAFSATAEAGSITLHRDTNNYTGNIGGGEFGATAFSGLAVATSPMRMNNFSGIANTAFQTFCIEGNSSTILNDLPMDFAVSGSIVLDNGSTQALHEQTAFLFTKFWNGNLYSGAQGNLGSSRIASATDLQEALWFFEGFFPQASLSAGAQSLVSQANTAVASGGEWFGRGLGDVRVLNLTNPSNGANLQDVLVLIAVPLPPAALLGLALIGGLGVAGAVRRRRRTFDA